MKEAVRVGEKNGFQCFAIHMRDDTSVVLGCYTEPVSGEGGKGVTPVWCSAATLSL